jgi:RHH-type rel operon transcriptional repressor/antitoxin RelB
MYNVHLGGIKMLAVRLDAEMEQELDRLAKETGRTKTFYVKEALTNYLADIKDYYDAQDVLNNVKLGKEKVHSSADVRSSLGLDD